MSDENKKPKSGKKDPVIPPAKVDPQYLNHIDEYFTRLERKIMNYFDRLDRKVDKNLFYFAAATSIFCMFIIVYLFVKG